MGGVRNGNSLDAQAPAGVRPEPLSLEPGPAGGLGAPRVSAELARHLQAAAALLREGSAPRAFGELVRASRGLPMTGRLAAALVSYSLKAGTEAAAIMVLGKAVDSTQGLARLDTRRQLARVLRRVDQVPRAIEALDALLVEAPTDRRALRVLEALLQRTAASSDAGAPAAPQAPVAAQTPESAPQASEPAPQTPAPAPNVAGAASQAPESTSSVPGVGEQAPASATAAPQASNEVPQLVEWVPSPPEPAPQAPEAPPADGRAADSDLLSLEDVGGQIVEPAREAAPEPPPAPPKPPPGAPKPAADPRPERAASQRLEAQLIARKRWRELAQVYLERADRAADAAERAEALTRLAEVMETELHDVAGAARTYGDIVALTGERSALKEQVRLLAMRGEPAQVQRALDEAVKRASTPKARAAALLTRAEHGLSAGQTDRARGDFDAAESLVPGSIPVLAGLLRCAPDPTRAALLAVRLRDALRASPRRSPDRLDALRTLSALAEGALRNPRLAQWAWNEVLAENPEEPQARERLVVLARELKDPATLGRLLREQLGREPRGPAARGARMELVGLLESSGDADGALAELRQAVRMEPGHKQAWLLLVERCIGRGQNEEAAWALEHAATAMEDEAERMHAWARLGAFCRDVLKDASRARVFLDRADNMRRSLEPARELGPALGDDEVPVPPTAVLSWDAPPGRMEPVRHRSQARAPEAPVPAPAKPAAPALSEPAALQMLRERPLEASLYRILADAFHARGLAERGALMQEVADALEGRESSSPEKPRVRLATEDRAGLRHPGLRTPAGELFACVGLALCRLFPAYGPAAGTNVPILKELGPGSPAVVEAIEVAARVLDLRLPDILLSEEAEPSFSIIHASSPRILVGKLSVQQPQSPAGLRFHAGSALFCLAPDLLALRSLKKDQLLRGLSFLSAVLFEEEGVAPGPEGRVLRDALPERSRERAATLLEPGMRQLDIPALAEAARHSANRAGLVVCGAVGPALAVLRARRAPEAEVVELVRFAASERYLQLRTAAD
ncbi:hypothetical protein P2318_06955 [Myxococcaceae bacterium GXIMD 01537]